MGRRVRGRGKRRANGNRSALAPVLKQIEENTRANRPIDPPQVPDKIPMRLSEKKITTFKREYTGAGVSVSTSNSSFGVITITLGNLDSTGEVPQNWQMYRIIEVTVRFTPIGNFVNVIDESNTEVQDMGHLFTVIDYRSSTVPTSLTTLKQYKNVQVVRCGANFSRTFTPHTLGATYGGLTTAYSVQPSGLWLSTEYNDAVYYGMKWGVSQAVGVSSGSTIYQLEISAVIQCKDAL